jgi:hypothetical protein
MFPSTSRPPKRPSCDDDGDFVDWKTCAANKKKADEELSLPRRIDIKTERPDLSEELKMKAAKKLREVFGHERFLSTQQKVAVMYTLERELI